MRNSAGWADLHEQPGTAELEQPVAIIHSAVKHAGSHEFKNNTAADGLGNCAVSSAKSVRYGTGFTLRCVAHATLYH